jgi:hypothetical protein
MITITITLPTNTPANVIDRIEVSILDNTRDRQPRATFLEGLRNIDNEVVLEFTER